MTNLEFKKDPTLCTISNLALDSIVNVGWTDGSLDARISSYGIFGTLG